MKKHVSFLLIVLLIVSLLISPTAFAKTQLAPFDVFRDIYLVYLQSVFGEDVVAEKFTLSDGTIGFATKDGNHVFVQADGQSVISKVTCIVVTAGDLSKDSGTDSWYTTLYLDAWRAYYALSFAENGPLLRSKEETEKITKAFDSLGIIGAGVNRNDVGIATAEHDGHTFVFGVNHENQSASISIIMTPINTKPQFKEFD